MPSYHSATKLIYEKQVCLLISKYMATEEKFTLNGSFCVKKAVMFGIAVLITAILWNLPLECFGIDGLTIIQRRIIAVFVFATLLWLTEAIPSWATSVALIGVLLLTTSDNSLIYFRGGIDKSELLHHQAIMASFADPIIILFLGGFMLAIAATKSGLDVLFARTLLRPFGTKSENVLLGFILITGLFSMFVSNTATAAMMLTFLVPIFKAMPSEKGRVALTLAIPVAANIGGMGTPIGTPPNAIAMKYINDPAGLDLGVTFGKWMLFMMPFTIVLLLIGWFLLKTFFPFTKKEIKLEIKGDMAHNWRTAVVAVTFILTVMLWILENFTGIGANTVAIVPIVVFAITGVVTADDLKELNWAVIWMVAGGFALGLALNDSGLAENVIHSIPFDTWSPLAIMLISGLICYILSNFISNTATTALLVPILAVVCRGMGTSLNGIGGASVILIGVAISASMAMCLPISTPPNAIAHSTGLSTQKQMMKIGLAMGIIGLAMGYTLLILLGKFHIL